MSKISSLLTERKQRLSLAESITGGSLSYSFVKEAGASTYFLGSIVAYDNETKKNLLGVSERSLELFGEVSLEVAQEMALGSLKKFDADCAIGVTGFAGPLGKEVGKVAIAFSSNHQENLAWVSHFQGDRSSIIEQTVATISMRFYEYLRAAR